MPRASQYRPLPKPTNRRDFKPRCLQVPALSWSKEIAGWALSLAILIALAAVLREFDGKRYAEWNLSITLNALVSVLISIFYVLLMIPIGSCLSQLKWVLYSSGRHMTLEDFQLYDAASRSVLSSAYMILKRPRRYVLLSTTRNLAAPAPHLPKVRVLGVLACILFIVVTAVGPFAQQILGFASSRASMGSAFLPVLTSIGCSGDQTTTCAKGVNAAFIAGLSTPVAADFDVEANCTSSNCTWPPYATIIVASRCVDLTAQISLSTNCDKGVGDSTYGCNPYGDDPYVNLSLANGHFLYSTVDNGISDYLNITTSAPMMMSLNESGLVLLGMTVVHLSAEFNYNNGDTAYTTFDDNSYFASECVLQFAGQNMTANQTNGRFLEEASAAPVFNNTKAGQDRSFWNHDSTEGHSSIQDEDDRVIISMSGRAAPFVFSYDAVFEALYKPLAALFYTTQTKRVHTYYFDMEIDDSIASAILVQALHDSPSPATVATSVNNAAKGLTRYFRSNTVINEGANVSGHSTEDVISYQISWGWIALPAALVLLTLALMAFTAVVSRRAGLEMWADSTLPSLFNGLRGDGLHGFASLAELEAAAKGTRAYLDRRRYVLVPQSSNGAQASSAGQLPMTHLGESRVQLTGHRSGGATPVDGQLQTNPSGGERRASGVEGSDEVALPRG